MLAAQICGRGQVTETRARTPVPTADEVLLRTLFTSICGSDLHAVYDSDEWGPGNLPPAGFPGHASVGIVVESGVPGIDVGMKMLILVSDLKSRSLAEYQVAGPSALLALPDASSVSLVDFVVAQQLGTVIYALKRFGYHRRAGQSAVVMGAGAAGLHFIRLLRRYGFESVIAVEPVSERRDMARRWGADRVFSGEENDLVGELMRTTGGSGFELSIDASGRDDARNLLMHLTRQRGTVGFFGLPENDSGTVLPMNDVFRREPCIMMAVGAQQERGLVSFRQAIQLIESGQYPAGELLTHRFALADIALAMDSARGKTGGLLKAVIDFALRHRESPDTREG